MLNTVFSASVIAYSSPTSRPSYAPNSELASAASSELTTLSLQQRTRSNFTAPAPSVTMLSNRTSTTPLSNRNALASASTAGCTVSVVTENAKLLCSLPLPYASTNMPSGTSTVTVSPGRKRPSFAMRTSPFSTLSLSLVYRKTCSALRIVTPPSIAPFTATAVSSSREKITSEMRDASARSFSGSRRSDTSGRSVSTPHTHTQHPPFVWKKSTMSSEYSFPFLSAMLPSAISTVKNM